MAYKSPLNYIGNKYRMIGKLKEIFPDEIETFVDLFCGGCDVVINVSAKRKFANDINWLLIDMFKAFKTYEPYDLLRRINKTIEEWGLSKENEEGFLRFREYYNETGDPVDLYVLTCYSFNYQLRFNSDHKYNNPFGRSRSSFSPNMRRNLLNFCQLTRRVEFSSVDFIQYDFSSLTSLDFVYADPPYLISTGSYNDGKRGFRGWGEDDERALLNLLAELDRRGVRFALSNVLDHKGRTNTILGTWVEQNGYCVHDMSISYDNCNYHAKDKGSKTREVVITNYNRL